MNKIFSVIIMLALCMPAIAFGESSEVPVQAEQAERAEVITDNESSLLGETQQENESIHLSQKEELPHKQPVSKKQLAKKFIIAMLCVVGTSIFLYIALSLYNKIRTGFFIEQETTPYNKTSLEVPEDIEEAVKSFVEKTRWED